MMTYGQIAQTTRLVVQLDPQVNYLPVVGAIYLIPCVSTLNLQLTYQPWCLEIHIFSCGIFSHAANVNPARNEDASGSSPQIFTIFRYH